jgi:hypothetical protein
VVSRFYGFCREKREPTSGLENRLPIGSSYEFACVRTNPYWCVRKLRLFRRFSMVWRYHFVHCVPARISPVAVRVAVHSWSAPRARDEVCAVGQGTTEVDMWRVSLGLEGLSSAVTTISCQPPRRGVGPLLFGFRFPSVASQVAATARRARAASSPSLPLPPHQLARPHRSRRAILH